MHIVMITPEIAPVAKVGGLGDMVVGLSRELIKNGHEVEIIAPHYACARDDLVEDMHVAYEELWSPHFDEWWCQKVYGGKVQGIPAYFVDCGGYTARDRIYGYDDDLFRFVYFNRVALEFLFKTDKRPDILHAHDWGTALVPVIYYDIYEPLGWDNSRTVFTIHNNECQGLCWYGDKLLGMIGLDSARYHLPDKMRDDGKHNCINLMRGGIVYSNFVTTVSPRFAEELKHPVGGRGLHHALGAFSAKVGGVINGIDYETWNPATDPLLPHKFDVDNFDPKYGNKFELRQRLGLQEAWKPIVSVVTRLTHQKGLDMIKAAVQMSLEMQCQFVLLGESPDPAVNGDFWRMRNALEESPDCCLWIGYNEDLAHLIYAGSDLFLVPSLFEPCGLTQMIALRYGTVPVVRETGGLADTVFDVDNSGRGFAGANGFTFQDATPEGLASALGRAVRLWFDHSETFGKLARNGMRCDYSWKHPARHYENIYNWIRM